MPNGELPRSTPATMSARIFDEGLHRSPYLQRAYFSRQEFPIALFGVDLPAVFLGQYTTIKQEAMEYQPDLAASFARVLVAGLDLPQARKGDNSVVRVLPDQSGAALVPFEVTHAHIERPFLLNAAVIGTEVLVGSVPGSEGNLQLLYAKTQNAQKQTNVHIMAIDFTKQGEKTVLKIGDEVQVSAHDYAAAHRGYIAGFRLNMPGSEHPEVLVDVLHGEKQPLHQFSDYYLVSQTAAIL